MHRRLIVLAAAWSLICPLTAYAQELWVAKDGSIRNVDTRDIQVAGGAVYLATKNELYAAFKNSERWASIFLIPAGDNEITCVDAGKNGILVGTRRGLYRSQDHGKSWKNIFKTLIPEKSSITAITLAKDGAATIMIATARGVFSSDDGGERWRDMGGALKNKSINCLAMDNGYAYAGLIDGLYRAQSGKNNWERLYVYSNSSDTGVTPPEEEGFESEESVDRGIVSIVIEGQVVYAATDKVIIYSDDACRSWKALPHEGLSGSINCILASKDPAKIYCATSGGVFVFARESGHWDEIYKGLKGAVNVRSIIFADPLFKTLWASTDSGAYKIDLSDPIDTGIIDIEKGLHTMAVISNGEPSFKELQAAAMKYNEVSPEKIRQWRTEARMKALVPKISMGLDNSTSNSYEIYTSATKDYVVGGPDDVTKGVDVSVSWDLGNIIWSDDQTSIDVRSRLTTQLRNDILDDLRRVYYERKRLQYELVASPPKEAKLRFEKELRVQELTQAIDDITGNYLSGHTVKISPENANG